MRHALLNTPVFSSQLNRFRILISQSRWSHFPCKKHQEIYIYIYATMEKTKNANVQYERFKNGNGESR